MANVTDEQQQKGNLGGPDLFLAPVGRLDSDKISKYFCNTCEKDYEGSPKIEYENPNEEVAENLTLVERGQYICNNCGSTLAEYREFQKPDVQRDVGAARPLTSDYGSTFTPPTETAYTPPTEPSYSQPSDEPPLTMPTFDEPTSISAPSARPDHLRRARACSGPRTSMCSSGSRVARRRTCRSSTRVSTIGR